MSNGFSNEEMIKMILDGQGKIQVQLVAINDKVDKVMTSGCAHREDDLRRIKDLEGWRTKGIVGTITLFLMAVAALIRKM